MLETGIFITQLILKMVFITFTVMAVAAGILLRVSLDPDVTRFATLLQVSGIGQFLMYFFLAGAFVAQLGDMALSWVRWWVEAQGKAE